MPKRRRRPLGHTAWRDRMIRLSGYRMAGLHFLDWDAASEADGVRVVRIHTRDKRRGQGEREDGDKEAGASDAARTRLLARLIAEAIVHPG